MKKRSIPSIQKPVIDEETALLFAAAAAAPNPKPLLEKANPAAPKSTKPERGKRQITLTISKALYDAIANDAASKQRTIEDHFVKHLANRYE
jgi:hypothetical protein